MENHNASENIIWRQIEGFKNYKVSNTAQVKYWNTVNSNNIITQRIDRAGYYTVRLSNEGKSHTQYVHRLVAKAFLPNHQSLKFVNHRNGVKTDNNIRNLEWVSHSSNIKHAYDLKLIPQMRKQKVVVDLNTGDEYQSVKEASTIVGMPYPSLKNYLNGSRKNRTNLKYK